MVNVNKQIKESSPSEQDLSNSNLEIRELTVEDDCCSQQNENEDLEFLLRTDSQNFQGENSQSQETLVREMTHEAQLEQKRDQNQEIKKIKFPPKNQVCQSVDFQRQLSKKNLQIHIAGDENYQTQKMHDQETDQGQKPSSKQRTSRRKKCQLQSILGTFDKDCEEFQEQIERLKNSSSNKENISQCRNTKGSGIHSHQISLSQNLESPNIRKPSQIQTGTVTSPKIKKLLDSKETSKHNSAKCKELITNQNQSSNLTQFPNISTTSNSLKDMKTIQALREYSEKIIFESQVQTEKRSDQKLINKLQIDIQLLTEIVEEEKERNSQLQFKFIQELDLKQEGFEKEKQNLNSRINELEDKVEGLQKELGDTQKFYEEMISELQLKLFIQQQYSQKEQKVQKMTGLSKIEGIQKTNQSSVFFKDDTIEELGFELSPNKYQDPRLNNIQKIIENAAVDKKFKSSQGYKQTSPSFNNFDYSYSSNNSSALMTSDIHKNPNVSSTLTQLDNFNSNVRLIKHFNKPVRGDHDPLKFQKLHQSSILDCDDSIICEEADINVNQIKSSNFHIKRQQEEEEYEENMKQQWQYQQNLQSQIFTLINQIDGYLLNQTGAMSPQLGVSKEAGLTLKSGYQINNLATFGPTEGGCKNFQAQSLTGTQRLNELWNEMQYASNRNSSIMQIGEAQNMDESSQFEESDDTNEKCIVVSRNKFEESLQDLQKRLRLLMNNK